MDLIVVVVSIAGAQALKVVYSKTSPPLRATSRRPSSERMLKLSQTSRSITATNTEGRRS